MSVQFNVLDLFKIWILFDQIILSLKYQVCTTSECKDIVIRKFEYDAKTQFLFVVKNAVLLRVCNDALSKFVLIGNGNDFFSQAKIF